MSAPAATGFLIAGWAFARTRWRADRLRTLAQLQAHQQRQIERLLHDAARDLPFYRALQGRPLQDFPIIDKAGLMARFEQLNRAGLTAEAVRRTLAAGHERIGAHVVGQSTGTSGNRGYYVITEAERFVWLGTLLAKALPDALWQRHRVALALPGLSRLYRSASTGSRIALAFFDLAQGVDAWADELAAFAPDTIVAPPKVLRRLAERGQLTARHVFSGAEVLDAIDRQIIEAASGQRLREIYMATEGLFGVSCPLGTLHLAEDVVHFEWQRPDAASALVMPLITDFTRRAQSMIRYRMNDLLELADTPCACGSPYRAVTRIEGRHDDAFLLRTAAGAVDGGLRLVTPDVLRNAVVDAAALIQDFRVVQTGADAIVVTLDAGLAPQVDAAVLQMLQARLAPLGVLPLQITVARGLSLPFDRKLRRVRRDWQPDPPVPSQP